MLILGGFNAEIDESQMKSFDETNNLKKLIKHPMPLAEDFPSEIINRSRLRNKFLKKKIKDNCRLYVKEINKCVFLLKKTKNKYCKNLD